MRFRAGRGVYPEKRVLDSMSRGGYGIRREHMAGKGGKRKMLHRVIS